MMILETQLSVFWTKVLKQKGPPPEHDHDRIIRAHDAAYEAWRTSTATDDNSPPPQPASCERCVVDKMLLEHDFTAEFGSHLGTLASEHVQETLGESLIAPFYAPRDIREIAPLFEGPEPVVRSRTVVRHNGKLVTPLDRNTLGFHHEDAEMTALEDELEFGDDLEPLPDGQRLIFLREQRIGAEKAKPKKVRKRTQRRRR